MGSIDGATIQIPVIDISDANPNAPAELLDAACRFGFVFVANNDAGVARTVNQMFDLSKQFFALPTDIKQQVSISSNKAGKNHGWLGQGVEKLDPATQKRPDVKEAFNMGQPNAESQFDQSLPDIFHANLPVLLAFNSACHTLCTRLLTHFATALSLEPHWFTSRHDPATGPSSTVFRLLYYPAPSPDYETDVDIRAGAHSDYGSLTCLFQLPGQPGLEIQTPSGEWAAVPVDPTNASANGDTSGPLPILVNIGDLFEDWTAGLLKSTVHRVVFPRDGAAAGDRYSMAYFGHPNDDTKLETVPSPVVEEFRRTTQGKGPGGRQRRDVTGLTARDHLMERLAATYSV